MQGNLIRNFILDWAANKKKNFLPSYNSLKDNNLMIYFSNQNIRKLLHKH